MPIPGRIRPLRGPRTGELVKRAKHFSVLTGLCFGYVGSPGIYQDSGDGTKEIHRNTVSADPGWNGPDPFDTDVFVDDGMLATVRLCTREEEESRSYASAMVCTHGPDCLNLKKIEEEGRGT